MESGPERQLLGDLARGLKGTFLDGQLILGGSSGLFGFATDTPAFTEDLDFLIREDLVVSRGTEIVDLLRRLGFERQPETPTFIGPGKPIFDLVGYSTVDFADHLSVPGPLRVMVYGDLGIALSVPGSTVSGPDGSVVLSPAAFCAVKLMTVRVEKGAKDKLQALLVIAERGNERRFVESLQSLLDVFDSDRRDDAWADSQAAFLSLKQDPNFRDRGAEGYLSFVEKAEKGFEVLSRLHGDRSRG